MKAIIFDLQRGSFVDGPGIRTTVFFKGCNLRCKWCHNPESQEKSPELIYYRNKCSGCGKCKEICKYHLLSCSLCGKCALFCPNDAREICGKEQTTDEIMDEIMLDKRYYDSSNGGVTFSGGECMLQLEALTELLKRSKEKGVHTAVDTAGNVPRESFERILPYTDLFLYDVKCVTESLHKEGTGVSNRLILSNLEFLASKGANITVRYPVIPSFNDKREELTGAARLIYSLGIKSVELLPYHAMGEHKWLALNKPVVRYSAPTDEQMAEYRKLFNQILG